MNDGSIGTRTVVRAARRPIARESTTPSSDRTLTERPSRACQVKSTVCSTTALWMPTLVSRMNAWRAAWARW
jgi:hypothetical protein